MPRIEDVTDYVLQDSSRGPGDHPARVAKAAPAKQLTPTLTKVLDDWNRQHDRSIGYTSKALAYGFKFMKPSVHSGMIRLVKGGHLRVCRVFARPPAGSNAHSGSPYGESYYLLRPDCPAEVPDGTLRDAEGAEATMSRKAALAKLLRDGCLPVFRGVKPKGRHGFATDAGYYGAGLYYTTARDIAKWYADHDESRIVERCLRFKNPLIMGIRRAQQMAIRYGTAERRPGGGLTPLRTLAAKEAADKLTARLRRQGHDGLIVIHKQGKHRKESPVELIDLSPPPGLDGERRRRR